MAVRCRPGDARQPGVACAQPRQAHMAIGGARARRFPPDAARFAALESLETDAWADLAAIAEGGALVARVGDFEPPAGWTTLMALPGLQMILESRRPRDRASAGHRPLGRVGRAGDARARRDHQARSVPTAHHRARRVHRRLRRRSSAGDGRSADQPARLRRDQRRVHASRRAAQGSTRLRSPRWWPARSSPTATRRSCTSPTTTNALAASTRRSASSRAAS